MCRLGVLWLGLRFGGFGLAMLVAVLRWFGGGGREEIFVVGKLVRHGVRPCFSPVAGRAREEGFVAMKLVFPLAVRGAFVRRRSLLEFGGAQKRDIDQGVKQRKAAFEAVGVARGAGDAPEPSSPPSRGGVADEVAALVSSLKTVGKSGTHIQHVRWK